MSTPDTFLQHSIESPRHRIGTTKRNKRNPNWKEVKLLLFADNMIVYIENPKVCTKKLLELINELNKVSRYKVYRNLLLFYTLIINIRKRKQENNPLIISKRMTYRGLTLSNNVKDLHLLNYEILMEETEHTNKQKNISFL